VFSLGLGFAGSYEFTARDVDEITLSFSLASPSSVSTSSYTATVTVTAFDEIDGEVAQEILTVGNADVGINKLITVDIAGQIITKVTVSVSFSLTSPFLATSFNLAGFGVNFRQFFITESAGVDPDPDPDPEDCACEWTDAGLAPDTAWTRQTNACAPFTLEPLPATTWTKRGCP
jgi:hypothetical protein